MRRSSRPSKATSARVGSEDVALFCYSGDGSQGQPPEQFWKIEPDHLDETLVLYGSRNDGSWDLADKELAKLISLVADKGADVVVLLDYCHSGSEPVAPDLAETAVRHAPTDTRPRPLDSFIFFKELAATSAARDLEIRPAGWDATGRYVLLAACRDDEEAKEYQGVVPREGPSPTSWARPCGLLAAASPTAPCSTGSLPSSAARSSGRRPSLRPPFPRTCSGPSSAGRSAPAPSYFVASYHSGGWVIDGGRVHGVPAATPDDSAELALFDYKAADDDLKDSEKALGKARITRVLAASSQLQIIEGTPDPVRGASQGRNYPSAHFPRASQVGR